MSPLNKDLYQHWMIVISNHSLLKFMIILGQGRRRYLPLLITVVQVVQGLEDVTILTTGEITQQALLNINHHRLQRLTYIMDHLVLVLLALPIFESQVIHLIDEQYESFLLIVLTS